MHKYNKHILNDAQWQEIFKDTVNSFEEYVPVYCDGSVHEGRAGCGVFCQAFSLKARLSNSNSILTAELSAVYFALVYISK